MRPLLLALIAVSLYGSDWEIVTYPDGGKTIVRLEESGGWEVPRGLPMNRQNDKPVSRSALTRRQLTVLERAAKLEEDAKAYDLVAAAWAKARRDGAGYQWMRDQVVALEKQAVDLRLTLIAK